MPKVKISEYSATANSNTDVASINIDEGCAPSGINNAIRAIMGHLKDFQQGTNGDPFNGPVNGTLGATTASTANVTTLTTSSTVTHNGGTANGVAYLNGSKVLTTGSALVFDGTSLGVGGAPASKLDVSGTVRSTTQTAPTSGAGMELFYDTGGAVGYLLAYDRTGAVYKQMNLGASLYTFGVAGSTVMTIAGATGGVGAVGIGYTSLTSVGNNGLAVLGNVGIGTSSPSYKLDVSVAANGTALLNLNNTSTSQSNYGIRWTTAGTNAACRNWSITSDIVAYGDFGINQSNARTGDPINAGTTRLLIDSSGNLGIGVTSPAATLDMLGTYVQGGSSRTNNVTKVSSYRVANYANATNPLNVIAGLSTSGTNNVYIGGNDTNFAGTAATNIYFYTGASNTTESGTQRMSIDSSGGLILAGSTAQKATGTTWSNPSDKRLKDNIRDYAKGTTELMQVRVREWEYNGKGGTTEGMKGLGVVADEVMTVLPDTVENYDAKLNADDEETTAIKKFDATEITWLLVKTVQEQQALITTLTARITALESA